MHGEVQAAGGRVGGAKKFRRGFPKTAAPLKSRRNSLNELFWKGDQEGMARPREPIDLIAAKGRKHLTIAEYEERKKTEVTARADDIKPPAFLLKKEREKFEELAKQLVELKIMTNLDCDVLARYIRSETEYLKVTKQIQKIRFVPDKKSQTPEEIQLAEQYTQYNYLSKIQNRLMKACNENAKELGLTISSRCRLVIPKEKEEKPENKFMKHA